MTTSIVIDLRGGFCVDGMGTSNIIIVFEKCFGSSLSIPTSKRPQCDLDVESNRRTRLIRIGVALYHYVTIPILHPCGKGAIHWFQRTKSVRGPINHVAAYSDWVGKTWYAAQLYCTSCIVRSCLHASMTWSKDIMPHHVMLHSFCQSFSTICRALCMASLMRDTLTLRPVAH